MNIDIDETVVDEITRLALIQTYRLVTQEIKDLKREREALHRQGKEMPRHLQTDLDDARRIRKASRKLIQYYSLPDQYSEFLDNG